MCCEVNTQIHKYSPVFLPGAAHQRSCLSPTRSKRSKLYSIKGWLKHAGEGEETKRNSFQAGGFFITFSHALTKLRSKRCGGICFSLEVWTRPVPAPSAAPHSSAAAGHSSWECRRMLHQGQILPAWHSRGLTATDFK